MNFFEQLFTSQAVTEKSPEVIINPEFQSFLENSAYRYDNAEFDYHNTTGKYLFNNNGYCFVVVDPNSKVFLFKKKSYYGKSDGLYSRILEFGAERDHDLPLDLIISLDAVAGRHKHINHKFTLIDMEGGKIYQLKSIPNNVLYYTNVNESKDSSDIFSTISNEPDNVQRFLTWCELPEFE